MSKKPKLCHCGKPAVERVTRWWKCADCAAIYAANRRKARLVIQEKCRVPDRPNDSLRLVTRQVERGFAAFCRRRGLDRRKMYL